MSEINTRKRGSKWEYRFEGAKISGERKQLTKGGFRTKKEALEAGTKALSEYNNAGFHFSPSEISFSDYLDYWMENYCALNLKRTTYTNYLKKVDLHLKPALGQYKLKALTPAVLQAFINMKFNAGYSRNTLAVVKGVLSGSLSYAVEPSAFIQSNPMLMVKLPSMRAEAKVPTRKKQKHIITKEQMQQILERFPEGTSQYIPLLLAYHCGLRLGETFALTWDDVNFDNKTIDINKQVQEKENCWTFENPKYDSSRLIKADSVLLDILKAAKVKQERFRDFYGEHYTKLFIDDKRRLNTTGEGEEIQLINCRENGTYIQPRVMQHCGRIVHYQLGLKDYDYHSLRHTHTTMLLEAGANPKDIQHRLGHKSLDITLQVYAHVTEKMQDDTISILESILK